MAKVVKLAQPGFDAKTAGDENLIYNSNWPLLKIYDSGFFSSDSVAQETVIAEHNLGYPPMFWCFSNQPVEAWDSTQTSARTLRSEFIGPLALNLPYVDNEKLKIASLGIPLLDSFKSFTWYIFTLDLTVPYTAPIIKTGGSGGGSSGTVFKLAKANKSASSSRLEDFVIHSAARSPLVHSVSPGKVMEPQSGGDYAFTVFHNLGYVPLFFVYLKSSSGGFTPTGTGSGGGTVISSDEQKVQFRMTTTGQEMTIVILKDPFLVDYSVKVSV